MPRRIRRHTLHSAAILGVMASENQSIWSITDVANACKVPYSSAHSVLQRLHGDGYLWRQDHRGGIGDSSVYFGLSNYGQEEAERLLSYIRDPVGALRGWVIQTPDPHNPGDDPDDPDPDDEVG